jgi:ABC-type glycerol-3-phosphate transport system substrate-binding protein
MPKKKVAIFFLLAFLGAAIFVYFTFPRTKDEIPKSNNQQIFPTAPAPGPNGVPVPETVPHPTTPKVPPGPSLTVLAWASDEEAKVLGAEADAFAASTGRHASLTIDRDEASYRRDLHDAFASGTPPDVCLVSSRDFSGLDPQKSLVEESPLPNTTSRSVAAFTVNGSVRAVPDEFSVDMLFYNEQHFDQAGIGYPDRHWNWDIMESISRAMVSLQMKNGAGQPIYPLELPADFDFWNILCAETGHPVLDLGVWHLSDHDTRESQLRALGLIHTFFRDLSVTAPAIKPDRAPDALFAQQRASLLIAPSSFAASLPNFRYGITLVPADSITRATLAWVNGWAVSAKSSDPVAARALAQYLAYQPVHAGWSSTCTPSDLGTDTPRALAYEAFNQALVPRIVPESASLAQFLDAQINAMAVNSPKTDDVLYASIQDKFLKSSARQQFENSLPKPEGLSSGVDATTSPAPKPEGLSPRADATTSSLRSF